MKPKKIILISLIVLLAVFAIRFFVIYINELKSVKDEVITVYDDERRITTVYVGRKKIGEVDGMAQVVENMNNTYCYIYPDGSLGLTKTGVYCINENKLLEIGEDMTFIVGATHSAYALMQDSDGVLYRYDGDEFEKLCDEEVMNATISGDGQYFSYTVKGDSYYGKDAESITKVEDSVIAYISENGEYMYGLRNLNLAKQLFIIDTNGNISDIKDDVLDITAINANGSEILINTVDGEYVLVNGKDLYKVSERHILEVYGLESDIKWHGIYGNFETFNELVAYEENKVITMFTEDYKTEVLARNCNSIEKIMYNNKDIYYNSEDGFYKVKAEIGADSVRICGYYPKYIFSEEGLMYCINIIDANSELETVKAYARVFYYNTDGELVEIDKEFLNYTGATAYKDGCLIFTGGCAFYLTENSYERKYGIMAVKGMFTDSSNENIYVYTVDKVYVVVDFRKVKLPGKYEDIHPIVK